MQTSITKAIGVCTVVVFLSGCFGSGAKTSSSSIKTPHRSQSNVSISPEARKDYDVALEAMRDGKNGKAKSLLNTLVKTYPDLSGPHTNLGLIYFNEQNFAKAEDSFLQAIEKNPSSWVSYNHLGIINRRNGKFKEAEQYYLKALDINQEYALAHYNIGILYDLYLGKLKKARDHYRRFQKLSPNEDKEVSKWLIDLERRIKRK